MEDPTEKVYGVISYWLGLFTQFFAPAQFYCLPHTLPKTFFLDRHCTYHGALGQTKAEEFEPEAAFEDDEGGWRRRGIA